MAFNKGAPVDDNNPLPVFARILDALGNAFKAFITPAGEAINQVTSLRAYFSDDFGGAAIDATKWDVYDGGLGAVTQTSGAQTAIGSGVTGITHSVATSALAVVMGTTNNAEKWFLSKQVFCCSEDITMVVMKSQALAANMIQIGLVEVDSATGFPIQNTTVSTEFTNKAVIELGQTATNTFAGLRTIGDNSPAELAQAATTFAPAAMTTAFEATLQIRAQDLHAQSAVIDSTAAKANALRVSSQMANDTKVYKLLMRFKNVSAPGSSTTFTVYRVLIENSQAMNVVVTESQGGQAPSQGMPVNISSPLPAGSAIIGYVFPSGHISGFNDTTTTLGGGATYTGTGRAATGQGYNYFGAFAYSDVAGTLYIDYSIDTGGTWREAGSLALVAGTVGFRGDLNIHTRGSSAGATMYRARFINGAGAQAAFLLTSAFTTN